MSQIQDAAAGGRVPMLLKADIRRIPRMLRSDRVDGLAAIFLAGTTNI
jgi:hypothetical protein